MKKGVIQFVLLKPLTSLLALIFNQFNLYHEGSVNIYDSFIYIAFVNNLSISVSMYCLALFYLGFEDSLNPHDPLSKFICIKFVLFFSFWQNCFFLIGEKMEIFMPENCKLYECMLICFEMSLAAIAHNFAFSYKDYVDYSIQNSEVYKNLKSVMNVTDLINDAENTFSNEDEEAKPLNDMVANPNPNI